jgi:hypothetical protein
MSSYRHLILTERPFHVLIKRKYYVQIVELVLINMMSAIKVQNDLKQLNVV